MHTGEIVKGNQRLSSGRIMYEQIKVDETIVFAADRYI